jgi:D-sedoheptulose 7-phosphate isomerase
MLERIRNTFEEAEKTLALFMANEENFKQIEAAAKIISNAIASGKKVISCGNGGSMCDAMHFAEELSGRFRNDRKALPAIAISDPSHISCVANDYGYDFVFSRFVEAMGNEGDVLLGISTSGNSKNVIKAFEVAKEKKLVCLALTGKDGGLLKNLSDIEIRAPYANYADRAQEIHIKIIHALIESVEYLVHN